MNEYILRPTATSESSASGDRYLLKIPFSVERGRNTEARQTRFDIGKAQAVRQCGTHHKYRSRDHVLSICVYNLQEKSAGDTVQSA